jgi:hypothetical protein
MKKLLPLLLLLTLTGSCLIGSTAINPLELSALDKDILFRCACRACSSRR